MPKEKTKKKKSPSVVVIDETKTTNKNEVKSFETSEVVNFDETEIKSISKFADILNKHPDFPNFYDVFKRVKRTDTHFITIGNLLQFINHNKIQYYVNNRGTSGVKRSRINDIKNDFNVHSLGMFHASYFNDRKSLILIDANHRAMALCEMFIAGDLTKRQLNYKFPIKVLPSKYFLPVYQKLNNTLSHSSNMILSNSDLTYGKMIDYIIYMAEQEAATCFNLFTDLNKKEISYFIRYIFENLDLEDTDDVSYLNNIHYRNINDCKSRATKDHKKMSPDVAALNSTHLKPIIKGVVFCMKYFDKFYTEREKFRTKVAEADKNAKSVKECVEITYPAILSGKSNTFIGYIISCAMRNGGLDDVDWFFERVMKRRSKVIEHLLLSSRKSNFENMLNYFDRYIT